MIVAPMHGAASNFRRQSAVFPAYDSSRDVHETSAGARVPANRENLTEAD
jgi:hypothetical protein